MLNPDLKKDIEVEINKADTSVKDYLLSDDFHHNIDLIIKVNKLGDVEGESLELETILLILGISNYTNILEAIKGESIALGESEIAQLASDINNYILSKVQIKKVETPALIPINNENEDESKRNVPRAVNASTALREQIVSTMSKPSIDDFAAKLISEDKPLAKAKSLDDEHDTNVASDPYLEKIDPKDINITKSI